MPGIPEWTSVHPLSDEAKARRAEWPRIEAIAKVEICAACGGRLDVATDPERRGWPVLRCNHCNVADPEHIPVARSSVLARWRRGEPLNAIDMMHLTRLLHRMINRADGYGKEPDPRWAAWLEELEGTGTNNMTTADKSLTTIAPTQQMMTVDEATRFVNLADFRTKLSPEMRQFVVDFMMTTGLNPALREFTFYENALYVLADGYRKVLNRSGKFDGMPVPPKYLSASEKEAQGYAPQKIVVQVALQRKGQRFPVYAIGVADPTAPFRNNPVEKQFPQIMAETRAFRRAARAGFQDVLLGYGLDAAVDLDMNPEEDIIPEREYITARVVDVDTGEVVSEAPAPNVIDSTADEVTPAPAPEPGPKVQRPSREQYAELKGHRERLGWTTDELVANMGDPIKMTPDEAATVINTLALLPTPTPAAVE